MSPTRKAFDPVAHGLAIFKSGKAQPPGGSLPATGMGFWRWYWFIGS